MNYPAWQLKKGDPAAETSLAGAGCGVLLRRVLAARGCNEPAAAQAMLGQGEPLSDPFLLKDMDKAVARIEQAVENEELMVIYGDYDVDGISATAILYECLTSQGAHVRCKLPTRGSGYGLTRAALESLAQKGFKLVVTVDNGISAVEEAACARELGVSMEECLYLGDTNTDMKTGINAGAVTVGVTWGFRDREELEAFSPAYIADHPGDVVQIVKDVNGIEEDGK